ncbi:hypothetical protein [Cupriavidus sp. CP313]
MPFKLIAAGTVVRLLGPGGYAEVRLIAADALMPLPDDLTFEQAAAVLTKGLTAWAGLYGFHRLMAGETVLVQGASSSGWLAAVALGQNSSRQGHRYGRFESQAGSPGRFGGHVLCSGDPDLAGRILAPDGVDVVYRIRR